MAKKIAGKNVGLRCDAEDNGEQRERELGEVEEESFMALEADDVDALAAAASKCESLGITLDDVRPAPEAGMFAGGARTHGLAWQLHARRSLDWLLDHSSDKGVGGEMGEIDLMSALVVCVFVSPDGSERDEALGSLEWLVGRLDGGAFSMRGCPGSRTYSPTRRRSSCGKSGVALLRSGSARRWERHAKR